MGASHPNLQAVWMLELGTWKRLVLVLRPDWPALCGPFVVKRTASSAPGLGGAPVTLRRNQIVTLGITHRDQCQSLVSIT